VERWLDFGTLTKCHAEYFFVTVLRDPVKRIVSHCRFERIHPAEVMAWTREANFDPARRWRKPVQRGTAVVDNFYTRSLLGATAYSALAPGAVTAAHAADAIDVLARFDAVLVLENYNRGLEQLFVRLGWCRPPTAELHRNRWHGSTTSAFDANQTAELARMNAPDFAVYAFAAKLAAALEAALPANPTFRACLPANNTFHPPPANHTFRRPPRRVAKPTREVDGERAKGRDGMARVPGGRPLDVPLLPRRNHTSVTNHTNRRQYGRRGPAKGISISNHLG